MSNNSAPPASSLRPRLRHLLRTPLGLMLVTLVSAAFLAGLGYRVGWWSSKFFEILAIVAGVISVIQAIKLDILNFPTGIACNVFFVIVFLKAHLYGNMCLQTLYIILGAHGWYHWARGAGSGPFRVTRAPGKETVALILIGVPAYSFLFWYLGRIGGAIPVLDALTTVLSLCAQYLLNMKRLANWAVGIGVDIIYTGMFLSQKLYWTAALFAFYLVMCIVGYREWRGLLRAQDSADAEPQTELIQDDRPAVGLPTAD